MDHRGYKAFKDQKVPKDFKGRKAKQVLKDHKDRKDQEDNKVPAREGLMVMGF